MKGTRWRVALVLIVAQAADVQHASAQAGPPPAPTVQVAPVQPYYAPSTAAGQSPIAVPPYPGAPPRAFSSAAQAADYNTWRLGQLTARQKGLTLLGRPDNYHAQLAGGYTLLAGGAGLLLTCFTIGYVSGPDSTSEDESLDSRREIGLVSAAVFGIGLALGGALWLSSLKRGNPYRTEIADLHGERKRVGQELKRARRQARIDQRMSFDFQRLQVRF